MSLCVLYDIIVAFTGLIFICCQVCRALTLTVHGNLQLEQIEIGAKPQRCAVILKTDTGTTWEAIIPDGESFGFNVQTWGETMRRLLEPIMSLSDEVRKPHTISKPYNCRASKATPVGSQPPPKTSAVKLKTWHGHNNLTLRWHG